LTHPVPSGILLVTAHTNALPNVVTALVSLASHCSGNI